MKPCAGQIKKVEPKQDSQKDAAAGDVSGDTEKPKDEHTLFVALFGDYNNFIRPDHGDEITRVFFELSLFNLLRVVSKGRERKSRRIEGRNRRRSWRKRSGWRAKVEK